MSKITIIVPVYNIEKYIRKCLDCITDQTYKDLEIILVDDGSTDDSGNICDEYAKNDNRIKVIHKENNGVSSARNTGLDKATGDYIAFIDSDDHIEPDYFETLYKAIGDCDMAVCDFKELRDGKGNNRTFIRNCGEKYVTDRKELFADCADREIYTYIVWAKLYRAELLKGIYFREDMDFGEDSWFIREVFVRCNKVHIIEYKGYNYYISDQGVTSDISRDIERRLSAIATYYHTIDICKANEIVVDYGKFERSITTNLNSLYSITKKERSTGDRSKWVLYRSLKDIIKFRNLNLLQKCKLMIKVCITINRCK